jgi:hypothetical protein
MQADSNISLQKLLVGDTVCAVASAALVAPLISLIDKAIFENASGKQPLFNSLKAGIILLASRPLYFVRQPSCYLILGAHY